jgi:hypothetical protein
MKMLALKTSVYPPVDAISRPYLVMIIMLAQMTVVKLILDVSILPLSVTMTTNVPKTAVLLQLDVSSPQ